MDLNRIYTTESKLKQNYNWINVLCLHRSEAISEILVSDVRDRAHLYM